MRIRLFLVSVLLLMLSIVFPGCSPKEIPLGGEEKVVEPKVLRFAIGIEPLSIDQQIAKDSYTIMLGNAIYEGLVRVSHNGDIVPGIAKEWYISEDGLTYTFYLRDCRWSDGKEVTAYDFEYAIKRLLYPDIDSEYAFQAYYIVNGEKYNTGVIEDFEQVGVKALDEKTLEIKIEAPRKYFLELTSFISFFPVRKDFIEAHGNSYASAVDKMLYNGPFIMTEWKQGERLILEKNLKYWNKDAIKLDKVEIEIVTDSNTAMRMYEAKDLDLVYIPRDRLQEFIDNGKAKFYYDGAEFYLQYNLKGKNIDTGKFLANSNFRKALGYAIDRQDYIDTVLKDASEPATRYILPLVSGYNGLFVKEYPLDFYPRNADHRKAKEYIDKALEEIGTTIDRIPSIEFLTDDFDIARISAEAIQDMIHKNLGIKLHVKQVSFEKRLELMRKNDYDIVFTGWGADYNDPMTFMDLWVRGCGYNNTNWEDDTYTNMINFCKTTLDMKARADKIFEAEKYLLENGPIVPVYFGRKAWIHVDGLTGIVRNFIGPDLDFIYADITR